MSYTFVNHGNAIPFSFASDVFRKCFPNNQICFLPARGHSYFRQVDDYINRWMSEQISNNLQI